MFHFRFALLVSTGRAALPRKASCCLCLISKLLVPNSSNSGSQQQKYKQHPYHWISRSVFPCFNPSSMPHETSFLASAAEVKTYLCLQHKYLLMLELSRQGLGAYINSTTLSMLVPKILFKFRHYSL